MRTPPYRTAYCGPSGVLNIEVSLYRTAYCGPKGVLIIEVSITVYLKSLDSIASNYCYDTNYYASHMKPYELSKYI